MVSMDYQLRNCYLFHFLIEYESILIIIVVGIVVDVVGIIVDVIVIVVAVIKSLSSFIEFASLTIILISLITITIITKIAIQEIINPNLICL